MHVKAKQVAFLGVLAAIVSLFNIFASLFETNTLFLLAASAYVVGIAIREFGLRIGFGFFIACILLGFLLSPNKLYVLTYAGLSLYIVWNEASYWFLSKTRFHKYKALLFFAKLSFFNLLYIPVLLLFPHILFARTISTPVIVSLLIVGQIGWFIYDKAYDYFQDKIWGKLRNKIGLLH
jgi:hypothetical protein